MAEGEASWPAAMYTGLTAEQAAVLQAPFAARMDRSLVSHTASPKNSWQAGFASGAAQLPPFSPETPPTEGMLLTHRPKISWWLLLGGPGREGRRDGDDGAGPQPHHCPPPDTINPQL